MISVIVPSYNVELYLERCVQSLVSQTYTDLEIILVDDGSTDGTGELCDKLARRDHRIKVIHKENGGLSDARNAGIKIATGEYYSFIDGDDFIEADTYECMISEMADPAVSIVAGGFFVTDIKGHTVVSVSPKRQRLTKEEAFMDLFGRNYITQSSCNKLFRSSLFDEVRYKKGILNEDQEILPRLLDIGNHVVLLDKPVYHYIKKPGSITSSDYSMERYRAIEIERDIYRMCRKKYPQLKSWAGYYELKSLYGMLCNLDQCSNKNDFKIQELNIRRKIMYAAFRCAWWKEVMDRHGNEVKTYVISAAVGIRNVKKLVQIKAKIRN